ncbi:MAG: flagellar biosynthesis anti-sigma factor FlgM [Bryobacteraceae bacterium]
MKIHDAYLPGPGPSQLKQAEQAAPAAPDRSEIGRKTTPAAGDTVGLSELSARLLELARIESPERAARIEKLTQQVRSGRYQVDALAVSRRIIEEAIQR